MVKAMRSMDVRLPSPHCLHYNEISSDKLRRYELNFLEEMRDKSQGKLALTNER